MFKIIAFICLCGFATALRLPVSGGLNGGNNTCAGSQRLQGLLQEVRSHLNIGNGSQIDTFVHQLEAEAQKIRHQIESDIQKVGPEVRQRLHEVEAEIEKLIHSRANGTAHTNGTVHLAVQPRVARHLLHLLSGLSANASANGTGIEGFLQHLRQHEGELRQHLQSGIKDIETHIHDRRQELETEAQRLRQQIESDIQKAGPEVEQRLHEVEAELQKLFHSRANSTAHTNGTVHLAVHPRVARHLFSLLGGLSANASANGTGVQGFFDHLRQHAGEIREHLESGLRGVESRVHQRGQQLAEEAQTLRHQIETGIESHRAQAQQRLHQVEAELQELFHHNANGTQHINGTVGITARVARHIPFLHGLSGNASVNGTGIQDVIQHLRQHAGEVQQRLESDVRDVETHIQERRQELEAELQKLRQQIETGVQTQGTDIQKRVQQVEAELQELIHSHQHQSAPINGTVSIAAQA